MRMPAVFIREIVADGLAATVIAEPSEMVADALSRGWRIQARHCGAKEWEHEGF